MTRRRMSLLRRGPQFAGLAIFAVWPTVAGAEAIGPDDLGALPPADVVILGEVHDNPHHHANQARAVAEIGAAALVFEMFGPSEALGVTADTRGDAGALAAALGWEESGWPDFALYYPVFEAAPEAAVFGGALPRTEVRRAVQEGAAAVMGGGGALFGLDAPLEAEEQETREALQATAHCDALPPDLLPGMVEAQRLRDAGLAQAVVAALAETGGPVAVITGNGHARKDWGIPRMLARALPEASVLSVGQFEAPPEAGTPFDVWLVTEPAERGDPCETFRK